MPKVLPEPSVASSATSVYVWGDDRRQVNAAARLVGARLAPGFLWVDASAPARDGPLAPFRSGNHRCVSPKELVPNAGVLERTVRSYLRPASGPLSLGRELQSYLRLPNALQEAVATLLERRAPRVLVVTNVDRLEAFDAREHGLLGQFVEFLNRHGISFVVASTSRPRPERIAFEYSVAIGSALPEPFRTEGPFCQWGACSAACIVRGCFSPREFGCIGDLRARFAAKVGLRAVAPGFAAE